jgi:hypothetical protein
MKRKVTISYHWEVETQGASVGSFHPPSQLIETVIVGDQMSTRKIDSGMLDETSIGIASNAYDTQVLADNKTAQKIDAFPAHTEKTIPYSEIQDAGMSLF